MRADAWIGACAAAMLMAVSLPAVANDEDRDAEARVLLATSGRAPQPATATPPPTDAPPPQLDGAALEAWFAARYGAPRDRAAPAAVADVPDDKAETALLADIERRRHDD